VTAEHEPPAPERRGRTEITERALEKIAARALTEVEEAGGVARRVLGIPLGRGSGDGAPQVTAWIDGSLAGLWMRISLGYPAPIRDVTRRLRDHVRTRVGDLTGLDVRQVDIEVVRLLPAERAHGRVR
jgi:uncharacterized alkaline shock family protein YloU